MSAPTVTVTLLIDSDRYYVTAEVQGRTYELGVYSTANEAGQRMSSFVTGHGYQWAKDSAKRLDQAQRNNAKVLILEAVPQHHTS